MKSPRTESRLLLGLICATGFIVAGCTTYTMPGTPNFCDRFIEGLASDDQTTACNGTAAEGMNRFIWMMAYTYGADFNYSPPYNCRCVDQDVSPPSCPGSELSGHAEGRAIDWWRRANDPGQAGLADAFAQWLLFDQDQLPSRNTNFRARRMQVEFVAWNHNKWSSQNESYHWRPIPSKYDQHTDHIHIELSRYGAGRIGWPEYLPPSWWEPGKSCLPY